MATKLLQILDDNAPDFKYGGGQWTLSTLVQWYQQTSNYPAFVTGTTFGSFTLTFQGTSIAFIGNTPDSGFSQTATVSIDGGAPSTITYPGPPPAYIQWYQSPTLAEGTHTITVGHLDGTAVDYALIEVGQNTLLTGKTIVADDDDAAIVYSGSWKRNTDQFDAGSLPDGFPLHNTTHRSSTVGDTVTFRFSGTSYAVYGVFSWENLGLLSATYTLDGSSTAQSYPVTTSSGQYIKGDKEAVNLLYFSQDNLSNGDHTLVINITQSQNVLYMLDYITYTPSFSSLATMPNLTNTVTTSVAGSSASASATSISGSTAGSTAGSTSPTGMQTSQHDTTSSKSTPVGAIAGGAVGGIVILCLLAFLWTWMRKRRSKTGQGVLDNNHNVAYLSNETGEMQPFNPYSDARPSDATQISPFQSSPYDSSGHYASINDLKRERFAGSPSTMQRTVSPYARTVSPSAVPSSPSIMPATTHATSTTSDDLEYSSDRHTSGPPAYDALVPLRATRT